jgi:hypothetical protein
VHSLMAAPGSDGGMAVSAWIVDKGEPMATPVPAAAPAAAPAAK